MFFAFLVVEQQQRAS